jgi:hypothetical protein
MSGDDRWSWQEMCPAHGRSWSPSHVNVDCTRDESLLNSFRPGFFPIIDDLHVHMQHYGGSLFHWGSGFLSMCAEPSLSHSISS